MSADGPGLSDDDRRKIEQITKYGVKSFRARYGTEGGRTAAESTRDPPDLNGQDRRGLSIEQCNAIRAAAADGHSYRYISSLFGFLKDDDGKTANRHATGRCQHGRGDLPAVLPARDPGPPMGSVSEAECEDLRRELERGRFMSLMDAAKYLDRAESVAHRHLHGECSHDTDPLDPPHLSPEGLKRRRDASGWTQYEFADVLGTSRSAVADWEQGRNALRYCVAFAVDAALPTE